MKKAFVCLAFAVCAAFSWGDVITNYVYVVSNIFNQTFTERVITNKVQNTHFEYYFTNNVYTVTNRTILVSQTNLNVNVINTNFGPWIARCEQAAIDASNSVASVSAIVSSAASSATSAGSSASAADAFAHSASNYANQAGSSANTAISTINTRLNNFDVSVNAAVGRVSDEANSGVSRVNSAASSGLANINNQISWFQQHVNGRIDYYTWTTNVTVLQTIEHTTINNSFGEIPYTPDTNLKVDLNSLSIYAKGGTNNTFSVTAPTTCATKIGSSWAAISNGSFSMRFLKFELMDDGTGKFWYTSSYDTGVPSSGTGYGWRFVWAYWYAGVWHVAINQRQFENGNVTSDDTFEMTLTAEYPDGTGTFANRPSHTWSASNSTHGRLTASSSETFAFVERLAVKGLAYQWALDARDAAKAYADTLSAVLSGRIDSLGTDLVDATNRLAEIETAFVDATNRLAEIESGSPHVYEHGGTTYSRITVYTTETANGKVSAEPTTASSYAAASYTVTPTYRYPTTTASTWTFVPAYVDTDANGLRLQYVPTTIHAIRYSSSSSRYLVPEYLYWQNGYVYMKIKTYVDNVYDDGYVIGRFADSNFPNNYTTSKTISKTSGNSWSSSNVGSIVGASTVSPAGSLLWFPASVSPSYVPTISWMMTGQ